MAPAGGRAATFAGEQDGQVLVVVPVAVAQARPEHDERLVQQVGIALPLGRQPLAALAPRPLAEATVFTTFPEIGTAAEEAAFHTLARRARLTRYGMDCYAYALVASGQVDLVIEAGLAAYDIQAPIAVIEAAGGVVTDWEGGKVHMGGRVVAAANAAIHTEALAVLNRTPA